MSINWDSTVFCPEMNNNAANVELFFNCSDLVLVANWATYCNCYQWHTSKTLLSMLCEVVSKLGADSFDLPRQLLPLPDLARKIEGDSACRVTIESAFLLNYFLIFFFTVVS